MSKFAEAAAAVAKLEGYPYDHVNSHHRDIVRAVLQALRESDQAMRLAGRDVIRKVFDAHMDNEDFDCDHDISGDDAQDCLVAMIDAILSEDS